MMSLAGKVLRSDHPDLPSEGEIPGLRRWNLAGFLLHLASAIGVLAIANDFTLPVNASWAQGPPGAENSWPVDHLFDLPLAYAAAAFALMSALAHLVVITAGWRTYTSDLAAGFNRLRWIEYAFSSSLMIVLIAMLTGIYDLAALIALAGVNASMILFGWTMDSHNRDRRARGEAVSWISFNAGCVAGAVPWIAIGAYLLGAPQIPNFVLGIYVSLFVFFNIFALVMLLEYKRLGPWKRVIFAEKSYIVLSFVAKVVLTWQVAVNVLID